MRRELGSDWGTVRFTDSGFPILEGLAVKGGFL